MVSKAVKLCGTELVDPPLRTLRAGPLSVEFDNGALRYVRFGGAEVLRGIGFLVRDQNWGTYPARLERLKITEGKNAFSVTYRGVCADATQSLTYDVRIEGRSDGALRFEANGLPDTDVITNRTGFIVLHPAGLGGRAVTVLHVDGAKQDSEFPVTIDPRCPFKDIRALTHEVTPGVWATCTMEGDAFEMEDQRNWSDASFKTYVRPLTKPYPYTLPRGVAFSQSVTLSMDGKTPRARTGAVAKPTSVKLGGRIGKMPRIGLSVPADEAAHALTKKKLVRGLGVQALICQVDLRDGKGLGELADYRKLADLTGADVTLEIITKGSMDPEGELDPVAAAVADAGLRPSAVTVFPAQDIISMQPDAIWPQMPTFEQTYAAARKAFPGVPLGGGMAVSFTELNRKRPPAAPLDFVTHMTSPNVHAADDISVMETNEAIPYQIASTRAFMGETLDYRIGPSQLGCRENPYGKATSPNPDNGRVCLSLLDPRQRGLFNAAWMIAYVAACARGKVSQVTLGAPTGPLGHIYRKLPSQQPYFDVTKEAVIYPGYHVIAGMAGLAGADLLATSLSDSGAVEAIAARRGDETNLWLANLTPRKTLVALPRRWVGHARLSTMDARNFTKAVSNPGHFDGGRKLSKEVLELQPYAVVLVRTPG